MKYKYLAGLLFLLLFMACHDTPTSLVIDPPKDGLIVNHPIISIIKKATVLVSAYLVYEDGTLSDFDVLNDHTKALWNTIIVAGDAGKPTIPDTGCDIVSIEVKNKNKTIYTGNIDFHCGE